MSVAASEIVVRPVLSQRERRDFLDLPWTLYRRDPNWIPPLRQAQKELIGYRPHPFYERNEAQTFVAYLGGEACGRIAAIFNRGHIERFGERRGYFGFFECVNDRRVSRRLFDAARQWLAARDLRCLRGPMDPAMDYGIGVLVAGFGSPPTFLINYNPPYYAELVEDYGFRKAQDLYSFALSTRQLLDLEPRLNQIAARFQAYHRLEWRRLSGLRYLQDAEQLLDLCNRSSDQHWGYIPMTREELRHAARSMRPLIVPEFARILELDHTPVGAVLALPDYNPRVQRIDGRLFPLGFLRLLWNRCGIRRLRVVVAGALPEYRRLGMGVVLLGGLARPALRWGIQECEFSWVAESNALASGSLESAGATRTRTHRVYDLD